MSMSLPDDDDDSSASLDNILDKLSMVDDTKEDETGKSIVKLKPFCSGPDLTFAYEINTQIRPHDREKF